HGLRVAHCLRRTLESKASNYRAAMRGLLRRTDLLGLPRQRFDHLSARLGLALQANALAHRNMLERMRPRLAPHLIFRRMTVTRERIVSLDRSRRRAIEARVGRDRISLDNHGKLLASLGYQNVLARGFTLVRDEKGRMLRRAEEVRSGQALDIEFADSHVRAHAAERERKEAGLSKPGVRPKSDKQGSLL
ncbi:MAG TPA: exodeoxyribonuclease VII large subunit, partial [Methyloceanibacter sp.]